MEEFLKTGRHLTKLLTSVMAMFLMHASHFPVFFAPRVEMDILDNHVIRDLYLIHCHHVFPILYTLIFDI